MIVGGFCLFIHFSPLLLSYSQEEEEEIPTPLAVLTPATLTDFGIDCNNFFPLAVIKS